MLNVQALEVGYPQKKLFGNIHFSCRQGQFTCLLGRNGAGKSSLIRTLIGLQPYNKGEIYIFEKSLREYSAKELAQNIAIVLSEKPAQSYLTVWETVALGRNPYLNWLGKYQTEDLAVIQKALEITETQSFSKRYLDTLSDGERQRVMLARALAQDTPIIILDEPTAYLDVFYRKQILLMLRKIAHQQQKCILLSTHEVELALGLADQLLLVNLKGEYCCLEQWENDFVEDFLEIGFSLEDYRH
jgi:iron complex transport system ATP-binding protein